MCNSHRRHFLALSLVAVGAASLGGAALAADPPAKKVYVCPPCGCAADGKEFPEPGTCPECGMPLVEKKPDAAPKLSKAEEAPRSAWTGKRQKPAARALA